MKQNAICQKQNKNYRILIKYLDDNICMIHTLICRSKGKQELINGEVKNSHGKLESFSQPTEFVFFFSSSNSVLFYS